MFPRLLQATLNATVAVPGAKLWSIPRPYLYVLVSEVISASGAVLDQVNTTVGFRSLNYTGDKGFFMVRACPSLSVSFQRHLSKPRIMAACLAQIIPKSPASQLNLCTLLPAERPPRQNPWLLRMATSTSVSVPFPFDLSEHWAATPRRAA